TVALEFETTEPVKMVYTANGREPKLNSEEYKEALIFTKTTTLKIRSVLLSGKMSKVRTIRIEKQKYAPELKDTSIEPGLQAEYYKGIMRKVSELSGRTPDETERISTPQQAKNLIGNYNEFSGNDFCSTVLTGYINIPTDGVYYFSTDAELWINNELLISNEADNDGTARRYSRSDKSVALSKGLHPVKIIRIGGVFGGWPAQWQPVTVSIRRADEAVFKVMNATYFQP
ncbi:MAG: chitobiase/beta-hexosaminidase C-terminal domain-containing protein, partial [Prevotellaceae bacterium]|nr:chitobiase/beta-hexosaminidase C-terminal domain-containing protein [Prevotellaceae bacterium]